MDNKLCMYRPPLAYIRLITKLAEKYRDKISKEIHSECKYFAYLVYLHTAIHP